MSHPLLNYFKIIVNNNLKKDFELTVFVTNYCNEACEHCFYSAELNTKKPEFDTEAFRKIAQSIPPYCRKIILAGGEPFMRSDLFEIVKLFKEAGVKEFGLVTNGTLTNKILKFADEVKALKGIRVYLQVSMDGPEALHDKIRKHKGAYKRAIETLKALKERNMHIGVQTAISRSNYHIIESFDQDIYDQLQVDVHYQFVRGAEVSGLSDEHRNSFDPPDKTLVPNNEEIKKYLNILQDIHDRRIRKRGGFFKHVFAFTTLESKYIIGEKRTNIFPCIAGKKRGVVYPSGETAVCEYFKPVAKKLQDLGYNFNDMWQTPEILEQHNIAKDCHCTHGCYVNIVGTHRFFRYFLRNGYRFLSRLIKNKPIPVRVADVEKKDDFHFEPAAETPLTRESEKV